MNSDFSKWFNGFLEGSNARETGLTAKQVSLVVKKLEEFDSSSWLKQTLEDSMKTPNQVAKPSWIGINCYVKGPSTFEFT